MIRCLVIEADGAPGNVPDAHGGDQGFDRLPHCETECRDVATPVLERLRGLRRPSIGCYSIRKTVATGTWHTRS